jgi:hypothetical protein
MLNHTGKVGSIAAQGNSVYNNPALEMQKQRISWENVV